MIRLYIYLAAAVIVFGAGWEVRGWREAVEDEARLEQQRENERANARSADAASEKHEENKAEISTEFKTIYKEVEHVVEKPVYRDGVCLDPDGLRIITKAIGNSAATGKPSPAVREPVSP